MKTIHKLSKIVDSPRLKYKGSRSPVTIDRDHDQTPKKRLLTSFINCGDKFIRTSNKTDLRLKVSDVTRSSSNFQNKVKSQEDDQQRQHYQKKNSSSAPRNNIGSEQTELRYYSNLCEFQKSYGKTLTAKRGDTKDRMCRNNTLNLDHFCNDQFQKDENANVTFPSNNQILLKSKKPFCLEEKTSQDRSIVKKANFSFEIYKTPRKVNNKNTEIKSILKKPNCSKTGNENQHSPSAGGKSNVYMDKGLLSPKNERIPQTELKNGNTNHIINQPRNTHLNCFNKVEKRVRFNILEDPKEKLNTLIKNNGGSI